jgi:hypothetical protein
MYEDARALLSIASHLEASKDLVGAQLCRQRGSSIAKGLQEVAWSRQILMRALSACEAAAEGIAPRGLSASRDPSDHSSTVLQQQRQPAPAAGDLMDVDELRREIGALEKLECLGAKASAVARVSAFSSPQHLRRHRSLDSDASKVRSADNSPIGQGRVPVVASMVRGQSMADPDAMRRGVVRNGE